MSGTSFSSWSLMKDPVNYAVKVTSALNCSVPANIMKNHQERREAALRPALGGPDSAKLPDSHETLEG